VRAETATAAGVAPLGAAAPLRPLELEHRRDDVIGQLRQLGRRQIEQAVQAVQDSVRQGRTIAAPLALQPIFPSMVTQMIAVGEDSGALETMLEKISDFYDSEVQSTTEALTSLIEPLMIAFLGVVLGGMIVALYLPIFDIFNQVQ